MLRERDYGRVIRDQVLKIRDGVEVESFLNCFRCVWGSWWLILGLLGTGFREGSLFFREEGRVSGVNEGERDFLLLVFYREI